MSLEESQVAADILVRRLADVLAKIGELEIEAEGIKQVLRDNFDAGAHEVNGVGFKVTPGRRFNAEKAIQLVPESRRRECLTIGVDPAKVKRLLTSEQVDECMDPYGKAKVSVG